MKTNSMGSVLTTGIVHPFGGQLMVSSKRMNGTELRRYNKNLGIFILLNKFVMFLLNTIIRINAKDKIITSA